MDLVSGSVKYGNVREMLLDFTKREKEKKSNSAFSYADTAQFQLLHALQEARERCFFKPRSPYLPAVTEIDAAICAASEQTRVKSWCLK